MKRTMNTGTLTVKSLLLGSGVGLLILAAGCALASLAIHHQMLPEGAARSCAWAICALSGFTGCMTAMKSAGKANLVISLCCALLLLLCMVLLRLVLTDGEGWSWYGAIILCAAAVAAAFVGAGRGIRRR